MLVYVVTSDFANEGQWVDFVTSDKEKAINYATDIFVQSSEPIESIENNLSDGLDSMAVFHGEFDNYVYITAKNVE
jgi:hypothetical protein